MNKIKLYYAKGSNSSNRIKWVLDYKKIKYELVYLDGLIEDDYRKINPFCRVPSLEFNEKPLSESVAMVELIEEVYPEPKLLNGDPFSKAKVREVCEIINATIHPVQNSKVPLFFLPNLTKEEVTNFRIKWLEKNLILLEPLLFNDSLFAVGKEFSLADIFLICIYCKGLELGLVNNKLEKLNKHIEYCLNIKEIKLSCPLAYNIK